MLLEFSVSNFRSIRERADFSMLASSDCTHSENLITSDATSYRILRGAEIFGPNGSGKTSIIRAVETMANIVLNSKDYRDDFALPSNPHKLSSPDEPTFFAVLFIRNGIKYSYGFSFFSDRITEEYLYWWPGRKRATVFERSSETEFEFTESFRKCGESIRDRLRRNSLILSLCAAVLNDETIRNAYSFFSEDLVFYPGERDWLGKTVLSIQDNPVFKEKFITFMNRLGIKLCDVDTVATDPLKYGTGKYYPVNETPKVRIDRLRSVYGKFELDWDLESAGVQKLYSIAWPLFYSLENSSIFIWDEIETHLHPFIVESVVNLFIGNTLSSAQLIFTSHDTDLLNLKSLRRDQIWFTRLDEDTMSTHLYSLCEYRNIRKDENRKRGYTIGRYGALPFPYENLEHENED